jgi:hypothetical protein
MVDIDDKLVEIKKLVDSGKYFTINKARQYGKTTTRYALEEKIKNEYLVINISFEGIGDLIFAKEENFSSELFNIFADSFSFSDEQIEIELRKHGKNINNLKDLSKEITKFCKTQNKHVVLIIDEVDKSSNNQLFVSFLAMLRDKYISRNIGKDITFHSVILLGVYDVKNLKLKLQPNEEEKYNSPWNIASEFNVDMSFNTKEISSMLTEYKKDFKIKFDIVKVSQIIFNFTNGYPYLVSKICKLIEEKLKRNWTENGIHNAVKLLTKENNTLFDSVIKNIENNEEFKTFIYELLIEGIEYSFVQTDTIINTGKIYGIFREENGKVKIDNRVFEILIYNHFSISKERSDKKLKKVQYENFSNEDGDLDIIKVLKSFQDLMRIEYRKEDQNFIEREGRLLFLAFIKPIINGKGFYFVEPQSRNNMRMDIVITYNLKRYIIELKIWRGSKYEQEGIDQLLTYIKTLKEDFGYLITFNFNINKEYSKKWIDIDGKKIFSIVV